MADNDMIMIRGPRNTRAVTGAWQQPRQRRQAGWLRGMAGQQEWAPAKLQLAIAAGLHAGLPCWSVSGNSQEPLSG